MGLVVVSGWRAVQVSSVFSIDVNPGLQLDSNERSTALLCAILLALTNPPYRMRPRRFRPTEKILPPRTSPLLD